MDFYSTKTTDYKITKILSIDDIGNMYTKLYDARDKWFDIGLALNIKFNTLKSIEREQHSNQGNCLREMLAHRIQSGGPLTWADLSSCLGQSTVGRRDLADEIDQGCIEHLKMEVKLPEQSVSSAESEGIVQLMERCPGVSVEGLQHESSDIERKFAKFTASIYQSLMTRKISKDSLVACLVGFSCLTKVFNDPSTGMSKFRKHRRQFEDPSTTVANVWSVVGDYISFFDYDVIETIVDTLGTDQDKQNMAEYKKIFEAYACRRLFIEISSDSSPCLKEGNVLLFVMLDSSYDDCEIGHLKLLQRNLSKMLKLNNGVLQLRKIRKGSVQLVFEMPDFITDIVFPLLPDEEAALQELGVTQLDCGDYHFKAKEDVLMMSGDDNDDSTGVISCSNTSSKVWRPVWKLPGAVSLKSLSGDSPQVREEHKPVFHPAKALLTPLQFLLPSTPLPSPAPPAREVHKDILTGLFEAGLSLVAKRVLSLLDQKDLTNCLLVSKSWRTHISRWHPLPPTPMQFTITQEADSLADKKSTNSSIHRSQSHLAPLQPSCSSWQKGSYSAKRLLTSSKKTQDSVSEAKKAKKRLKRL